MVTNIVKAAVLGSGVMGSGIAALLANAGISVLLLDRVPSQLNEKERKQGLTLEDKKVRNRISENAVQNMLKQKPAPLTTSQNLSYIETGNFADDIHRLNEADWIIEAVVENLAVKKQLLSAVDAFRKQGSIVSSNTSGLSITAMSEGRSEDFCRHFLGTHFFNPPRYLKLLELIPGEKTAPHVLEFMKQFGEEVLGKGVVMAKDTPNFIANRIGTYGLLVTIDEMQKGNYSIGEVDSVTGPLIGRPKSATFRTLDVVGIDTFLHVADTVCQTAEGKEKQVFAPPPVMQEMVKNGLLGTKSGKGFYVKQGKEIMELNLQTMQYEPRRKLKTASIEQSKLEKGWRNKLQTLLYAEDRAGQFLWNILTPVLIYAAEKLEEIAHHLFDVDQAMKWGFGWELGPFEMWDALGLKQSAERMKNNGQILPDWVSDMLKQGFASFYKEENGERFYYHQGAYHPVAESPKILNLKKIKLKNGVLKKNSGASLVDIGDGVALLEFHSPHNSIGPDILHMIHTAVDEAEKNYKGLVIGNEGKNFCVGANLGMILMEAQDDNLFELNVIVKQFQQATMKIKYSSKPVVAAPFGMTLGGGAEVCLPAAQIQAAQETYIGLVETGVGLIPGGGGTKELYIKTLEGMPRGVEFDLQKVANKVFETIAMAKVSGSAAEALEHNFLHRSDGISVNGSYLLHDAKQAVLNLYERNYKPPLRKKVPVTGETGYAALLIAANSMLYSGYISEHDLKIAKKLAYVISGGKVPFGTLVDEQYLLDLEREAFLSLVTEAKTIQRMQHMLMKGKPLRN